VLSVGSISDYLFDVSADGNMDEQLVNVDLVNQPLSLLQWFHSCRRDQTLFKTNEHPCLLSLLKEKDIPMWMTRTLHRRRPEASTHLFHETSTTYSATPMMIEMLIHPSMDIVPFHLSMVFVFDAVNKRLAHHLATGIISRKIFILNRRSSSADTSNQWFCPFNVNVQFRKGDRKTIEDNLWIMSSIG
jgi:hypothetical protein